MPAGSSLELQTLLGAHGREAEDAFQAETAIMASLLGSHYEGVNTLWDLVGRLVIWSSLGSKQVQTHRHLHEVGEVFRLHFFHDPFAIMLDRP